MLTHLGCQDMSMKYEETYNNLLAQIKSDDVIAYNRLYNLFYAPLCVYAGRYLSDIPTIEDCVQDVFFNVWKNRNEISIDISTRSYLYTATKNKCLNIIQKLKTELTYEQYILNTYDEYTAEELYSVEELEHILQNAIDTLPEKIKVVFRMSRFEHLTYKEIAERQEISIKTVESYIHKALIHLSMQLKEFLPFFIAILFLEKN